MVPVVWLLNCRISTVVPSGEGPNSVAEPGFPIGHQSRRGHQLPTWLGFVKFVCKNKKQSGPLGGMPGVPSLDPPMLLDKLQFRNCNVVSSLQPKELFVEA